LTAKTDRRVKGLLAACTCSNGHDPGSVSI